MKKKIECFLILLSYCCLCTSQQVVSSAGHSVKSDVSVDWILGGSLMNISGFDIPKLGKIRQDQSIEYETSLKVYPNPASDYINIEINPIDTGQFVLEFYNSSGVKVLNKPFYYQPVIQIDVSEILPGMYLIKLISPSAGNQLIRTEKFIKI